MRLFFCLALAAVLAGCAQTVDRPDRAFTVEAPQAWSAAPDQTVPVRGDWWEYFTDPGLDKAIHEALERNKDLAAAAARIDAAEAQARIAGAASLPEVSAGFSRQRQRLNFIGLPIPGHEGEVLSNTVTTAGLSLNLSWEADVWGKIKAGQLAAVSELQASEADLAGARLSLTGQTAKAWFAAIEAKRQVGLARATVESFELSAQRVRARFEAGVRPSLDLRLALTAVDQAKALLQQRQQQADASVRELEILVGKYPAAEYALAEDLPDPPKGVPAGLPSELVHRRPDLLASERRLLAADARIEQDKAALRPSFSLTSATGTSTNRLQDILSGEVFIWNLLGGLTQPIFNNGRLKATVRQSEAAAREAAALYENEVLHAYREVEVSLAADHYLEQREESLDSAVKNAMKAQELAEERYRSGLADIITVLDSQRTALDSESAWLAVRRARLDNRVDLHLALGGGFTMTVPSQVKPDPSAGRKTL